MSTQATIQEITREISAYKFSREDTGVQYEWLIERCKVLAMLLANEGAPPELVTRMNDIARYLAEQAREHTHSLVRQQTLVFRQDAIVFHLARQGYAKILSQ